MYEKLRIGIVGAGGMTAYHIPGFRRAGAEVVAVADPNPAAAVKCAKTWRIAKTYASLGEMLAAEKLDAVSVITPNRFHAPLAICSSTSATGCGPRRRRSARRSRRVASARSTRPGCDGV